MSKPTAPAKKPEPAKTSSTKAETTKPAKPAKVKGLTIGAFALECMKKGMDNKAVLEAVQAKFPTAKTGMASINWYRNKAVSDGVEGVRGSREITSEALAVKKAAEKKVKDAEKAKTDAAKAKDKEAKDKAATKEKEAKDKAKAQAAKAKEKEAKDKAKAGKPAPAKAGSALD